MKTLGLCFIITVLLTGCAELGAKVIGEGIDAASMSGYRTPAGPPTVSAPSTGVCDPRCPGVKP